MVQLCQLVLLEIFKPPNYETGRVEIINAVRVGVILPQIILELSGSVHVDRHELGQQHCEGRNSIHGPL